MRILVRTAALALLLLSALVARASDDEARVLAPAREKQSQRIELINRLAPTVVCMLGRGGGAGVIIDEAGYGLTNFHVIASFMDTRRGRAGLPDGASYPLQVLGVDITGDVAMFKLSGRDRFPAAPLGDSDRLRVGDPLLVMGNPFSLARDFTPSVSMGIVSGLHRYQQGSGDRLVYTDCIQTDAAINPGNSGGPMFDFTGRVVGINGRASFEERGRVSVGLGYAISSNQIRRFLPALRAGLLAYHGTLDATVSDASGRVAFNDVIDDSVAARAGIRIGDRLLQFDGRVIRSANQFASLLGTYPENWPVQVAYARGDDEHTAHLRLGRLPVTLREPVENDREQNLAEVQRTRAAFREAIGEGDVVDTVKQVFWRASLARSETMERIERLQTMDADPLALPSDVPPNVLLWPLRSPLNEEQYAGWSAVGGDELAGELLNVIEHQDGQHRLRFAFAYATDELRRVQVLGAGGRVERVYTYDDYRAVNGLQFPFRMTADAGASVEIVDTYRWD